jgi:hypothetical protein
MPSRRSLRLFVRGASLCVSLVLPLGVLTLAHAGSTSPVTVATRSHAAPTTTTAAPPVTVPPTIPPTTAAPKPAPVTTPTTARPRVTTAPRPAPRAIAQASTVPSGTPAERGAQALALINYPWQTLGYQVSFEPGRDTYLGLTDSGTRVIHVFVRDNESMDTLARTIGHEMGHALDFSLTTDAERAQYIAIRGINATVDTWFGCDACEDYSTAAGDWAETFQYYLFGPGQYFSKMGPPPSADQLAQLAAIFAPQ